MTYNDVLQFCQTVSKRSIAQWGCVGFAVIILWQVYLAMSLWHTLSQYSRSQDTKLSSPVSHETVKPTIHVGLKKTLFGPFIPKAIDEAGVKKSMLNVKVVGVLFAVPETDSEVILKINEQKEQTFRIGDIIPGQAVIKRITAQGVLLERKGSLESLSLPKNELIFEPLAKPFVGQ